MMRLVLLVFAVAAVALLKVEAAVRVATAAQLARAISNGEPHIIITANITGFHDERPVNPLGNDLTTRYRDFPRVRSHPSARSGCQRRDSVDMYMQWCFTAAMLYRSAPASSVRLACVRVKWALLAQKQRARCR
jgi:hypothetical protein